MKPRSYFVSILACISLILSAFATLLGGIASIGSFTMNQTEVFKEARSQAIAKGQAELVFYENLLDLFYISLFTVALLVLIASIALLNRKDWARKFFIALMGLGILLQLGLTWHFQVSPVLQAGNSPNTIRDHMIISSKLFLGRIVRSPNSPFIDLEEKKQLRFKQETMFHQGVPRELGFFLWVTIINCLILLWIVKKLVSHPIREEFT